MKDKMIIKRNIIFLLFSLFGCIGFYFIAVCCGDIFNVFGINKIDNLVLGFLFIFLSIIFMIVYLNLPLAYFECTEYNIKFDNLKYILKNLYKKQDIIENIKYKKTTYISKNDSLDMIVIYDCEELSDGISNDIELLKNEYFYSLNSLCIIVVPKFFSKDYIYKVPLESYKSNKISTVILSFIFDKSNEKLIPSVLKYRDISEINMYQKYVKKFYKNIEMNIIN